MNPISHYFSHKHGVAFSTAIPSLRSSIGVRIFNPLKQNYGVGGNTFRAYTGWVSSPSVTYRKWANEVWNQLNSRTLESELETIEGFKAWHGSLAISLQSEWVRMYERPLKFAHLHKLIDLFVKWLSSHNLSSPKLSECLLLRANCALDSQTLNKLNVCLCMALPISNPSMGDIHEKNTYNFCQDLIESFAAHYGGTRLMFDYFAWQSGGSGSAKAI